MLVAQGLPSGRQGGKVPERLELGTGLDVPARARRWIRGVCVGYDLAHLGEDAELLVTELVTNAVVHARTDCVVVAEKGDDSLRVEVIDNDADVTDVQPGPDVADLQPDADPLGPENGRGLLIVAGLAAAWGVQERPQGKTVWFTLPTVRAGHVATATPPRPIVRC